MRTRQTARWALIAAAALVCGAARGDEIPRRDFTFSYEATVPAPKGTERLAVWVPLPLAEAGVQEVHDLKIESSHPYTHARDAYGNTMLHVEVKRPGQPVTVRWTARIVRFEDRGQSAGPDAPAYRQPNRLIPLDGVAKARAEALGTADAARAALERARAIYDDVLEAMEYDKTVPGWGQGDLRRAMTVCKGNCTDFHARFIGVARASGLSSRFTMGIPLKPGPGSYRSYHCWAHFRDPESGRWKPVDISEADKVAAEDPARASWFFGHLDEHRIGLTYGRDLVLTPPQEGEPLNYFVFPYAEADGRPLDLGQESRLFRWADVESPSSDEGK